MATITIRIDDDLKEKGKAVLASHNISFSDLFRQVTEYIAETGRLPVQKKLLSEEDAELLQVVRERLAKPAKTIEVSLDDL